jgi:hypothetical protein
MAGTATDANYHHDEPARYLDALLEARVRLSTGALFVILMAAAGYWGSESHNRAAEAATDHRSPIPLRNDENNVCACSERPPRVPAGRSACGTVGSLEATAGN